VEEAKETKIPKKVGCPKKVIDYATVEKLGNIQCTQEEVASFLNISVRTLQRDAEFCRIYKKGLENGKMSIRRLQYKLAEKNTAMAIWLGKQYLRQRDLPYDESEQTINKVTEILATIKKTVDSHKAGE
jgi:hypothetical protein